MSSWLFEDLLPRQGLAVLHGPTGSCKSFVSVDFSERVYYRQDWVYGNKASPLSGRVRYLASENPSGISPRMKAWEQYHNPTKPSFHLSDLRLRPHVPDLLDGASVDRFIQHAGRYDKGGHIDFLVVDTLNAAMTSGDERSERDLTIAANACKRIVDQLNATVLAVYRTPGEGLRKSSALYGLADTVMSLEPYFDLHTWFHVEKQRNGRAWYEPLKLRGRSIQLEDGGRSLVFTPTLH